MARAKARTNVLIITALAAVMAAVGIAAVNIASSASSAYDRQVLGRPGLVAYWDMNGSGTEKDLTGHGHTGSYEGGQPPLVTMPNGDRAADFNGSSEYLTVPSAAVFSIPTTGELTWETWIRPDVTVFPHTTGGYVDWMGKCEHYSPTCEWEARLYNGDTTTANRGSRLSAYAFSSSAGAGSGADWQPADNGQIIGGHWYQVVGEYQTRIQPGGCAGPQVGGINIWVDGVEWDMAAHSGTGCMSQFGVTPTAESSPLNVGTMALDSFFKGAVGKVAIYDTLLTSAQIDADFTAMTGQTPGGSCDSAGTGRCVLDPAGHG
jgi:hypothetical protein